MNVPAALPTTDIVTILIRIGLIIISAFLFSRLAAIAIGRIERAIRAGTQGFAIEREKRAKTLGQILRSVTWLVLVLVASLMAIRELGFDITPGLAAAGGFGIAAGLGAQTLVRDWIAGVFIILDNQFAVGDVVRTAGVSGKVQFLSLQHTELRDGEGALHFIPNSEIKVVTNLSRSWSQPTVRIPIDAVEDPKHVVAVLREMLTRFAEDPAVKPHLEGEPKVLGIEDIYAGYFTVLLQVKTNPGQRLEMMRELRMAALHRLRQEGISVRPSAGSAGTT
ncbi:MAG: mechanosensitive ion channel [Candidatus Eisenbacteria bacterium]|uniref:Mechanosensitive ion channel n=1 Tax=Eiseniibacteriota bacterium TaxID=2212470 RepID=A0A538TID3_UNCEI|nr:MAG: mechanosensitive ion channel [Candidatus Eisenbacteria bacterium]TMQ63378.1 MAG: mechanosensitive ion channel [Candidatus Eisenbacteria bacterium]